MASSPSSDHSSIDVAEHNNNEEAKSAVGVKGTTDQGTTDKRTTNKGTTDQGATIGSRRHSNQKKQYSAESYGYKFEFRATAEK